MGNSSLSDRLGSKIKMLFLDFILLRSYQESSKFVRSKQFLAQVGYYDINFEVRTGPSKIFKNMMKR